MDGPANMNTGKMMAKLQKLPDVRKMSLERQQQIAHELTSPEILQMKFSHLLDAGNQFMTDMTRREDNPRQNTQQRNEHHRKMKQRIVTACNFPVKLSLQRIPEAKFPLAHTFSSLIRLEYGPVHAALIIGDVLIDWGRLSIVEPIFETRTEADFQALVGDNSEWKTREDNFVRQMSRANRNGSSVEKLEVLFQSMAEKTQMINRLVEVIVDYNRNKEFNVFTCNCQHFARDAMAALGIKKPVKFEGRLQQRFEQLKQGKICVPAELKTHENLDTYVQAVLHKLNRSDMEYLQCLYFGFHLPAIEESEDRENWKCSVHNCMSGELDRQITEASISLKTCQLTSLDSRNQQENNHILSQWILCESVLGATPDSREGEGRVESSLNVCASAEVVDTGPSNELMAVRFLEMSLPKQTKLVSKFKGYRNEVICKYRHHQCHSENGTEMANILTERERLFECYFSSFFDKSKQCILTVSEDHQSTQHSWEDTCTFVRQNFNTLCQFSFCLRYSIDLRRHKNQRPVEDTPLNLALLVDDIILEWTKPGLVVPLKYSEANRVTVDHIVIHQDLLQFTRFHRKVENWRLQIEVALDNKEMSTVISIMYKVTTEIERYINAILELTAHYNRYSQYNTKNCNNLHFIEDVLDILGITEHSLPATTLKQYIQSHPNFAALENDKNLIEHSTLDLHVHDNTGAKSLSEEREFLLYKYFVAHIKNWKTTGKGKLDWVCPLETCQLLHLLKL